VRAGPVLLAVAGGHDAPAGREDVLADAAVEGELQQARLDERGRLGELVEEEDALALAGQKGGRAPLDGLAVHLRQAAEVDRVQEGGPHVDQADAEGLGGLLDDGTFSAPRRPPEVQGLLRRDEGGQGLGDVVRAHSIASK
jgi:hypothetical protein